jgi:predicted dehydrogenase
MKQYRVGIIGHTGRGNYGHGLDTVWKRFPERFEIVGLADANTGAVNAAVERTGAARGFADYLKMLKETRPEILAICPRWIDRHHEYALAAAEHGCHVFIEKPFCPTLEQADEIARAFEMRHLKLAIAYQSRYSPIVEVVNQLIADGAIGEPLEIRGRGKEDRRGGGEDLWVLGSHVLDLFRAFFGNAATCRAAMFEAGQPVTKAHVKDGHEGLGPLAGDEIHAEYTFTDNRVRGYFSSVRNRGGDPSRFGLQIFGSQGVIDFYTNYLTPAFILRDSSWSPGRTGKSWEPVSSNGIGQPETLPNAGPTGGNMATVLDLVDAIEQDRPTLANLEDARSSQEMILGVFESHRQGGNPVAFPLENRKHPLAML